MSTASTARRYLGVDDAIALGLERAIEGVPVPDAAAEVYQGGLTPEAMATFAIRGLIRSIHDELAMGRADLLRPVDADDSRETDPNNGVPRGRRAPKFSVGLMWERVLSANYATDDDERKPLIQFTLADVQRRLATATNQAAGWSKVAEQMTLARDLLIKHKADTIGDLPEKAKIQLAKAMA